jgi:hypothetical protein
MSLRVLAAVVAGLLVAIGGGIALAVLVAEEPAGPAATTATTPRETATTGPGSGTDPAGGERTATERDPAASPDDERGIEQAVVDAVEDTESGRPPPGIEPGSLPGSDELSIDSVRAEGDRGSARLSSGAVVELRRKGGRWRVVSVRAP